MPVFCLPLHIFCRQLSRRCSQIHLDIFFSFFTNIVKANIRFKVEFIDLYSSVHANAIACLKKNRLWINSYNFDVFKSITYSQVLKKIHYYVKLKLRGKSSPTYPAYLMPIIARLPPTDDVPTENDTIQFGIKVRYECQLGQFLLDP